MVANLTPLLEAIKAEDNGKETSFGSMPINRIVNVVKFKVSFAILGLPLGVTTFQRELRKSCADH